jgi:hypothetical protein
LVQLRTLFILSKTFISIRLLGGSSPTIVSGIRQR